MYVQTQNSNIRFLGISGNFHANYWKFFHKFLDICQREIELLFQICTNQENTSAYAIRMYYTTLTIKTVRNSSFASIGCPRSATQGISNVESSEVWNTRGTK